MKTLLKNAKILKMTDDNIFDGHVVIEDNLIKEVGPQVDISQKYDKVIDCNGNLLMPGFKNAHTHSAMTFLRSKADDSSLHDWLFKEVFPRENNLHEGCIRELAKVAILEYLTSGITACLDQYFFIEEFKKACEEMGFRSLLLIMYDSKARPVEKASEMYEDFNTRPAKIEIILKNLLFFLRKSDWISRVREVPSGEGGPHAVDGI